jgi:hypothetical protein
MDLRLDILLRIRNSVLFVFRCTRISGFDSARSAAHGQRMQMASFDVDMFLRDYWQQRPLLIRNPWRAWRNPL